MGQLFHFGPPSEKAGLAGTALLVVFLDILESLTHTRMRKVAQKFPHKKDFASIVVCIPRELSYTTGAFCYHCMRGNCAKMDT